MPGVSSVLVTTTTTMTGTREEREGGEGGDEGSEGGCQDNIPNKEGGDMCTPSDTLS